jgi:hypothetical protein
MFQWHPEVPLGALIDVAVWYGVAEHEVTRSVPTKCLKKMVAAHLMNFAQDEGVERLKEFYESIECDLSKYGVEVKENPG